MLLLIKLYIISDISYEKGGYGRWTVRSNAQVGGSYVYASASERTAGAIDSVVWKNKEFINNFDHGRQLQVCAFTAWLNIISFTCQDCFASTALC